ncbi:RNA methyltransferase [Arcanobacterium hippocoleae]
MPVKNSQFKKVQGLYRSANRRKYEQAIVEGPQAVRELITAQANLVRDVYATERALTAHPDVTQLITRKNLYLHLLPAELFAQLSTEAQGILAVADIPDEPDLNEILANSKLLLFALRASDPGNLGTIIRAADAFGAQAVITGEESVEAANPKVIRSSVGSVFHLPVIESEPPAALIKRAKAAGYQVFAADGNADYYLDELLSAAENTRFNLAKPTLWVVGNEAHGFSAAERELADAAIAIRMQGRAESLNVAMAASICLYTSAQAQQTQS